jgi:hypothetical protein
LGSIALRSWFTNDPQAPQTACNNSWWVRALLRRVIENPYQAEWVETSDSEPRCKPLNWGRAHLTNLSRILFGPLPLLHFVPAVSVQTNAGLSDPLFSR